MKKELGQSIIELLIAMGVFVIGVSVIVFLILDVYVADRSGRERMVATFLAKEGLEAARAIRDNDWFDLSVGNHGIAISGNNWVFQDTPEAKDISDKLEGGEREIIVEEIDNARRKVTSRVSWDFTPLRSTQVEFVSYLTRWTMTNWHDPAWPYRKKITILASQVTADLQNFPVLISIIDPDLTKAQPDGDDILFTSSDGITKIDYERERFIDSTGNLVAWVNISSLSSTENTEIYMYYGNSGALDQQEPTAVWDSNYMGVWHLGESSGTRFDSANNNDLSESDTVSYSTNGKFGNALDLDISPEGSVYIADNASLSITGDMTVSAWIRLESLPSADPDEMAIVSKWDPGSNEYSYHLFLEEAANPPLPQDRIRIRIRNYNNDDSADAEGGTSLSTATWYYIVGVNNATDFLLYLSGILDVSDDNPESHGEGINDSTATLHIGRRSNKGQEMDGLIDEVRISNIARSDEWIETEYNNQDNPSTFYIIESEESI